MPSNHILTKGSKNSSRGKSRFLSTVKPDKEKKMSEFNVPDSLCGMSQLIKLLHVSVGVCLYPNLPTVRSVGTAGTGGAEPSFFFSRCV